MNRKIIVVACSTTSDQSQFEDVGYLGLPLIQNVFYSKAVVSCYDGGRNRYKSMYYPLIWSIAIIWENKSWENNFTALNMF